MNRIMLISISFLILILGISCAAAANVGESHDSSNDIIILNVDFDQPSNPYNDMPGVDIPKSGPSKTNGSANDDSHYSIVPIDEWDFKF